MHLSVIVLLILFQAPEDFFRKHFDAADRLWRAGNLAAAEAEYRETLPEAYKRLGRIYSARHDYKRSIDSYIAARDYREDSLEFLIDLAISYFYSRQYKDAINLLTRLTVQNPRSVAAHHMLGKSYFMIGDFEKAAQELETALKLAPKDYDVAYTLGLAYLKQRQLAQAKPIYDRMIAQLGNTAGLRVLIGRAYRETDFLSEAIEEFKKAVALDPHFPRVHYYLGLTYLLKDGSSRISDAMAEFKIELSANSDEFFANYYLGVLYTMERNWVPAITFLEKAARIQPNNPNPFFYLGQSYQNVDQHEKAIEALKKSISLSSDPMQNQYEAANAHFRLGQSLLKAGRTDEGQKELQLAVELKAKSFKNDEARLSAFLNAKSDKQNELSQLAGHGVVAQSSELDKSKSDQLKTEADYYIKLIATTHNNIGLLRAEQRDFRGAAEQFARAAKMNPQHEDINYNLGLAWYKAELYKDAIGPLEEQLRITPANMAVKQLLGLSYFMTENYQKASTLLSEVLAVKPNDATLYYPLALSLGKEGKFEAVNKIVEKMLALSGNSPQIHLVLAQAYYEQGTTDKALEELKTAQSLDDKVLLAHFYTGLIYLRLGKFVEATKEFETELKLNPTDIQAKYNLAYVLLANQQASRGIKLMREVIAAKPDYGNAHFELGKALLLAGDVKGATASLETAVKLLPETAHVHYQLGRAYLAAGRKAEGENQMELYKRLKDTARSQTNP